MGGSGSKNKLTKQDIEFLVQHTSFDERSIKELYKNFMADCPDGRLTKEKFEALYNTCFMSRDTKEFSTYVFRALDTDRNGYIDFREFMLATTINRVDNPEEKLHWAFKVYDVDGNGYIDKVEMIRIVKAIFQMLDSTQQGPERNKSAEEQALKIFTKLDKNGDGKLLEAEFVKGCLEDEILGKMLGK